MVYLTVVMSLHVLYKGKSIHTLWVESFPVQVGVNSASLNLSSVLDSLMFFGNAFHRVAAT